MQITLNTAESSTDELTALIALLASLGGRLPAAGRAPTLPTPTAAFEATYGAAEEGDTTPEVDETPSDSPIQTDFDSKGTPWDARIHSESKATVADGSWRKRRGVSDDVFNQVMAELHAGNDDAPPPPPADEPEGNDEQVPVPPAPTEETPSEPEPAASAPAAGEARTSGGQFADFAAFVAAVAKMPDANYVKLNEMAGVLGVAGFKEMKDHADKWDMFFSMMG